VKLANSHGLDPHSPQSWYQLLKKDKELLDFKGVNEVVANYDNSLGTALLALFPNIGLKKEKLTLVNPHKVFLDGFAAKRGFDPLLQSNWSNVTSADFRKEKGGLEILKHYGNSIINSVLDIYPVVKTNH